MKALRALSADRVAMPSRNWRFSSSSCWGICLRRSIMLVVAAAKPLAAASSVSSCCFLCSEMSDVPAMYSGSFMSTPPDTATMLVASSSSHISSAACFEYSPTRSGVTHALLAMFLIVVDSTLALSLSACTLASVLASERSAATPPASGASSARSMSALASSSSCCSLPAAASSSRICCTCSWIDSMHSYIFTCATVSCDAVVA
mmetsp:Transcript_73995/g.102823  ORF Transcript_73995/g.102823 Transcript_73995/m.102823 type:complete len:204 (-) Transcript_73995:657-1268(-)